MTIKQVWPVLILCHFVSLTFCQTPTALKPGDVHPNAKFIDADNLYPFNNGAAVIGKGTATALIDANGNFIIPYSKYNFNSYGFGSLQGKETGNVAQQTFGYGLFLTYEGVVVNSKGQIFDSTIHVSSLYNDGRYFLASKDGQMLSCYDANFKNLGQNKFSEVIKMERHYLNLRNQLMAKSKYGAITESFSDELVYKMCVDQFGMSRYGFINTKGEEVIPCKFSNKPSNFSSGLAKVKPADKSEFEYAYINTKGDVVLKFTYKDIEKYGEFGDFKNNIAYTEAGGQMENKGYILSKEGKITSVYELFKSLGLGIEYDLYPHQRNIIFEDSIIRIRRSGQWNDLGFINLKTAKAVEAKFRLGVYPIYFDAASGLSYAESYLGEDNRGVQIWRKGYINRDGVYMIVAAPSKSTW